MPIPKPRKGESKNNFISRFVSNQDMKEEFKDNKKRLAVAYSTWDNTKKKKGG